MDGFRWLHGESAGTLLISVVVCTYNPVDEVLARSLDAIISQDLDPASWELLVVDNNSRPAVASMPSIAERGLRVVTETEQGLSKARECGIRNTRGSILVFVDDDNIIESDYLSKVAEVFADPRIGVVSGAISPEYEQPPAAWVSQFESMLAVRRPWAERPYLTNIPIYNEHFAIGAGMAVQRKLLQDYYRSIVEGAAFVPGRVGSQLSSAEDVDLDFFAISRGYFVGTIGSLKLRHVIPAARTTKDYISRLAIAGTRSAAEVNAKWSDTFGGDVIGVFGASRRLLRVKCVVFGLIRWIPQFGVRYHFNRTILECLSRRAKTPSQLRLS